MSNIDIFAPNIFAAPQEVDIFSSTDNEVNIFGATIPVDIFASSEPNVFANASQPTTDIFVGATFEDTSEDEDEECTCNHEDRITEAFENLLEVLKSADEDSLYNIVESVFDLYSESL